MSGLVFLWLLHDHDYLSYHFISVTLILEQDISNMTALNLIEEVWHVLISF